MPEITELYGIEWHPISGYHYRLLREITARNRAQIQQGLPVAYRIVDVQPDRITADARTRRLKAQWKAQHPQTPAKEN